VGLLRFLCSSRSDIAYGVWWISRCMVHLRLSHLLAAKRILRYVKGTLGYGLLFSTHVRKISDAVSGYCDSDWFGNKSDSKSTAGYGGISSCEAEYIAASMGACQAFYGLRT